jgi:hypothetical protein
MDPLPTIPALPPHAGDAPWPAAIHQAHLVLDAAVGHAIRVLHQESDSIRLRFHREQLTRECIPILHVIESLGEDDLMPWLWSSTEIVGNLIMQLSEAEEAVDGVYVFLHGTAFIS